jgi:hypothetical protein
MLVKEYIIKYCNSLNKAFADRFKKHPQNVGRFESDTCRVHVGETEDLLLELPKKPHIKLDGEIYQIKGTFKK